MVKTLFVAIVLILAVSLLPSCKKCYNCVNTCTTCILLDSAHTVASQRTICSDSTWYSSVKDSLTAAGFSCTSAPSTYHDDWCVNNKNAVTQYLPYHEGNGAYTCTPK